MEMFILLRQNIFYLPNITNILLNLSSAASKICHRASKDAMKTSNSVNLVLGNAKVKFPLHLYDDQHFIDICRLSDA
jgi:hypothetical protein